MIAGFNDPSRTIAIARPGNDLAETISPISRWMPGGRRIGVKIGLDLAEFGLI